MTTLGLDLNELDSTVSPRDDLFQYVNGKWRADVEIPADKAMWGTFYELRDGADRHIYEILEEMDPNDEDLTRRRLARLYRSFMDEDRANERGATPLEPYLREVDALSSPVELARLIGRYSALGLLTLIGVSVSADFSRDDRQVAYLHQSGLSLPDEQYYREESFAALRDGFARYVERMSETLGWGENEARAARLGALETHLASAHWTNVDSRDRDKTSNLLTRAQLEELAGENLDLLGAWIEGLGVTDHFSELVVAQPSFVTHALEALRTLDLESWRDWLRLHLVSSLAGLLSDEIAEVHFDFFSRTLAGVPERRPRWQRAVGLVNGALGDDVGQIYVNRHYPREARAEMDRLVDDLLSAYAESIAERPWLTAPTRERALEKLRLLNPRIGYPRQWTDYGGIELTSDLVENYLALAVAETERQLAKALGPVEREEWFMTPQTVNAYYYSNYNQIVFPAAILQPPFFDPTADAAVNYGAIGAVIGHEIGHAFDDQGSKSDGTGVKVDWWTPEDRAAFDALGDQLVAQYDGLHPSEAPETSVNGRFTLGENIGDLGGVAIAWRAYRLRHPEPAPEIDGLSDAQRFFISYARCWRTAVRPEFAAQLVAVDPHSPGEFRCNQIVRNVDAFYEAFNVVEGDGLWLAPEGRVTIW
ncbi:MAG: peptidase M13 [Acidimicrobiaceae bacterium]|nr:peptidase M13 [Acidimicrobiaceae bacterium]